MSAGPILCVGQTVLDHVFRVERFSAAGGRLSATNQASRIGGLAARAACAAQRLRTADLSPRVRLVSAVGDDTAGEQLRAALIEVGLDIECIAGARTGTSAVLVEPGGERQVHRFDGDALQRAPIRQWPETCSGVLVDPHWPEAAEQALRHARAIGATSVLAAEVAPAAVMRALVPLADWCVFSRSGLAAWHGRDGAPEEAMDDLTLAAPQAHSVVTLGAEGALWRPPGGTTRRLPAFPIDAENTHGAGDVMRGALLLSLAEAAAPALALRRAMAAAALACRGDWPTRSELDAFLATCA